MFQIHMFTFQSRKQKENPFTYLCFLGENLYLAYLVNHRN